MAGVAGCRFPVPDEEILDWPGWGHAQRQAADPSRGDHVAIQQGRREGQLVRDVVEAVAGVFDWKPWAQIDLKIEQIPRGIGVLGAVQPPRWHRPRIRVRLGRYVQRAFQ